MSHAQCVRLDRPEGDKFPGERMAQEGHFSMYPALDGPGPSPSSRYAVPVPQAWERGYDRRCGTKRPDLALLATRTYTVP